jgi:hypothetical protein
MGMQRVFCFCSWIPYMFIMFAAVQKQDFFFSNVPAEHTDINKKLHVCLCIEVHRNT